MYIVWVFFLRNELLTHLNVLFLCFSLERWQYLSFLCGVVWRCFRCNNNGCYRFLKCVWVGYRNKNGCQMNVIYCLGTRRRTKSGLAPVIRPKVMFTGVVDENGQKVRCDKSSLMCFVIFYMIYYVKFTLKLEFICYEHRSLVSCLCCLKLISVLSEHKLIPFISR